MTCNHVWWQLGTGGFRSRVSNTDDKSTCWCESCGTLKISNSQGAFYHRDKAPKSSIKMSKYVSDHPLFRDLSEREVSEFKQWAHDNYVPGEEISTVWHPVVQAECVEIAREKYRNG